MSAVDQEKRAKKRKRPKAREGSQRDLINALFRQRGPLHGKKRIDYPIRKAYPDGQTYDIKRYAKGQTNKEEAFMITLIHLLGWPDPAPEEHKVDALYVSLGLVFECDETQHFDANAFFNQKKPGYQKERDLRINRHYTMKGFYVVRVRAADYTIRPKSKDKAPVWVPVDNYTVAQRTREAVAKVLELKKRNMLLENNYQGALLVWPDTEKRQYARETFESDALETELAAADTATPLSDADKLQRRETILNQETAQFVAAQRNELQEVRENKQLDNAAAKENSADSVSDELDVTNTSITPEGGVTEDVIMSDPMDDDDAAAANEDISLDVSPLQEPATKAPRISSELRICTAYGGLETSITWHTHIL
jgi:hypothetical protein